MPITYTYDPIRNILRSYNSGRMTVMHICEHFQKIADNPTIREGYIEVVHCAADTEYDFNSETARLIPIRFSELKSKKKLKAAIFIGASQLQWGIARMMKNLHEVYDPDDDIRVVRTEEEAEREIDNIIQAHDNFAVREDS